MFSSPNHGGDDAVGVCNSGWQVNQKKFKRKVKLCIP